MVRQHGAVQTIVELWRYPLKSARGESLPSVTVDHSGVAGDRTWACLDAVDGTVGSAKHPRRWGRLLEVQAASDDAGVALRVDGSSFRAGTPEADEALSSHVGRPVRLSREVPAEASLHRTLPAEEGMVPDWMTGMRPGDDAVTAVDGVGTRGHFVDFGAVHLVTTGELARLRERIGGAAVDVRRFRPNIVVDAPADWRPGERIELGDVVLQVLSPTPRCAIPGLAHGADVPADATVLRTLARHYRMPVADLGRAACFGMYAEVVRPGVLAVG